jgi:hypothetical protein
MIFSGFEMNACPPGPFRGAFGFVPDGFLVTIPKHEKAIAIAFHPLFNPLYLW